MKKGANTFPFHNLLPYSESNEGLFLFFSPSLNWIKEKSVATLGIRNICDKSKTIQSQFSHRVTSPKFSYLWIFQVTICIIPQYLSFVSLIPQDLKFAESW